MFVYTFCVETEGNTGVITCMKHRCNNVYRGNGFYDIWQKSWYEIK